MRFYLGQSESISRAISEEDVLQMARLTGDHNPVHIDEEFALKTRFKGRIAHGVFCSGYISAVLGTKLPGPGAIYLSQTLEYLRPVRIGDVLTAEVEVSAWNNEDRRMCLITRCRNQNGECVARGEARLLVENCGGDS